MNFTTLAKERYSCRKISSKPIEAKKLEAIKQAAIAAPTAHNFQPLKVWLIQSPEALEKVKSVTQQKFLHTSPACFIVGSDANQGWVREADSMNFADVDASIVATHIMLAIQDQGLASTWIGNFQPEKIKEVFPMMESYNLIAIFPVGYPEEDAKPSHLHTTRKSEDEFIETL